MRIQIITIGNELLEGQIINTNASFLCQKLYQAGYLPKRQISILDDPKVMMESFENSLKNFDVTICSGGLGPTLDDLTLEVACKLFNSELELDLKLLKKLQRRLGHLKIPHLEKSCLVPKKATCFTNHVGMVPGYVFKKGKKRLILLPGVPYEFKHLTVKEVLPLLKSEYPLKQKEYKKILHVCRVPESGVAPFIEELHQKSPQVSFGVYPHFGSVSIHLKSTANTLAKAHQELNPLLKALKKKYDGRTFDGKFASPVEALHALLIKKKATLSLAESCTGGALSACFTRQPGASKYFRGSIVAYHNDIKNSPLGVSDATLKNEGAVSSACAKEMALGANRLFKTDFAIATTGVAGPTGGTKEKPAGTVWVSIAKKNKIIFTEKFIINASREIVIQRTILYILAEFWMIRDNI